MVCASTVGSSSNTCPIMNSRPISSAGYAYTSELRKSVYKVLLYSIICIPDLSVKDTDILFSRILTFPTSAWLGLAEALANSVTAKAALFWNATGTLQHGK